MKIEQLTVENFKCFKREQTFDFSRLTILTGANSSGKSSVMYAILMALQSEDFPYQLSPNGIYVNLGDFKEIANNNEQSSTILISLKIKDLELNGHFLPSILIKTTWKEDRINFLPQLRKFEATAMNPDKMEFDKEYMSTALLSIKKRINYMSAFRQSPKRTYWEKNKAKFVIDMEGEGYIDQIVEWDKRSRNGEMKQLITIMKELDVIEDIKIKRLGGGRLEVLVKPINSAILAALSHVGSSVSQILPIIVADLQLPNDSTLFLAQPEILLHPTIQAKFADYIVHQINTTDKNYVIETHSEYILNRIRLAIVKGELDKDKLSVYFLENNIKDTEVHKVELTKTGGIKNAPDSFFHTYTNDIMDIALNSFAE